MNLRTRITRPRVILLVTGILIGALAILLIRFLTYAPVQVHYHANFAVYINGVKEEFKDPSYYEEVAVCSSTDDIKTVAQRSHMHDNVSSAVHVHDHVVTWGQFFQSIGWTIGPDFIQTRAGDLYQEDDVNKLNIIVNGEDFTSLSQLPNMIIGDEARLLVSYGNADQATVKKQYASVAETAHHLDNTKDPAACSGSEKTSIKDRFNHLLK